MSNNHTMKDLKIFIVLPILLLLTILFENTKPKIQTGDIAFTAYNSRNEDSFSIITLKDLPSNTMIYFTDSKWNGTRFSLNEGDLVWNSGSELLFKFTEIKFTKIKNKPISNHGLTIGTLNLNQKGDAIFAYTGENVKQPVKFIAAVSSDNSQYGTLANTKLQEGKTAITYPKNTYAAQFKGKLESVKNDAFKSLNNFNNYQLN